VAVPRAAQDHAQEEDGWKTTTLIAALRFDRVDAPMTIDGALDGDSFLAYVAADALRGRNRGDGQYPCPQGRRRAGGIVTKGAGVLHYSQDFDPIEKSFSKIKSILERIAAHRRCAPGGRWRAAKLHSKRMHELLRGVRL
jgi:hypothetical protein